MRTVRSARARAWSEFLYPLPEIEVSASGVLRCRQAVPRVWIFGLVLIVGLATALCVLLALMAHSSASAIEVSYALAAAGLPIVGGASAWLVIHREVTILIDDRAAVIERRWFNWTFAHEEHRLATPRRMWSYAVRDSYGLVGTHHYLGLVGLEGDRLLVMVLGDNWLAGRRLEEAIAALPAYQGRLLAMALPGFLPPRSIAWRTGVYPAPSDATEPGPETMLVSPQRRRITENLEEPG